MPFARYKGEAEKALLAAGFPQVYIFRPAVHLYPCGAAERTEFSALPPVAGRSTPCFWALFPDQVIRADDLAGAMVDVAPPGERRSAEPWFTRTVISRAMVESHRPQRADPGGGVGGWSALILSSTIDGELAMNSRLPLLGR